MLLTVIVRWPESVFSNTPSWWKMTKSAIATPGFKLGHVNTVNIDGSYKE